MVLMLKVAVLISILAVPVVQASVPKVGYKPEGSFETNNHQIAGDCDTELQAFDSFAKECDFGNLDACGADQRFPVWSVVAGRTKSISWIHSKTKDAGAPGAFTSEECADSFVPFINLIKQESDGVLKNEFTQLFPETVYYDRDGDKSNIGRFQKITYVGFANQKDARITDDVVYHQHFVVVLKYAPINDPSDMNKIFSMLLYYNDAGASGKPSKAYKIGYIQSIASTKFYRWQKDSMTTESVFAYLGPGGKWFFLLNLDSNDFSESKVRDKSRDDDQQYKRSDIGMTAINLDGNMCTSAGNIIRNDGSNDVITNIIFIYEAGCETSAGSYSAVDTRSPRDYYWSIDQFVFDRDQNNMKAIGMPIDASGNPYLTDQSDQILYIINLKENGINDAYQNVLALRFKATFSGSGASPAPNLKLFHLQVQQYKVEKRINLLSHGECSTVTNWYDLSDQCADISTIQGCILRKIAIECQKKTGVFSGYSGDCKYFYIKYTVQDSNPLKIETIEVANAESGQCLGTWTRRDSDVPENYEQSSLYRYGNTWSRLAITYYATDNTNLEPMKLGANNGRLIQLSMPNDFMFTQYTFGDSSEPDKLKVVREKEDNFVSPYYWQSVQTSKTEISSSDSCSYVDCTSTSSTQSKWMYRVKQFGRICYGLNCIITNGASVKSETMIYATTTNQIQQDDSESIDNGLITPPNTVVYVDVSTKNYIAIYHAFDGIEEVDDGIETREVGYDTYWNDDKLSWSRHVYKSTDYVFGTTGLTTTKLIYVGSDANVIDCQSASNMPYDNTVFQKATVEIDGESTDVPLTNKRVFFEKNWSSGTSQKYLKMSMPFPANANVNADFKCPRIILYQHVSQMFYVDPAEGLVKSYKQSDTGLQAFFHDIAEDKLIHQFDMTGALPGMTIKIYPRFLYQFNNERTGLNYFLKESYYMPNLNLGLFYSPNTNFGCQDSCFQNNDDPPTLANRYGYEKQVIGRIYFEKSGTCAASGCCFRALEECLLSGTGTQGDQNCLPGFASGSALKKESQCPDQVCPSNIGITQTDSSFSVQVTQLITNIDISSNLAWSPTNVVEKPLLFDEIEIYNDDGVKVYPLSGSQFSVVEFPASSGQYRILSTITSVPTSYSATKYTVKKLRANFCTHLMAATVQKVASESRLPYFDKTSTAEDITFTLTSAGVPCGAETIIYNSGSLGDGITTSTQDGIQTFEISYPKSISGSWKDLSLEDVWTVKATSLQQLLMCGFDTFKQYQDKEATLEVTDLTHTKIEGSIFSFQLIPAEDLMVYLQGVTKGGVKANAKVIINICGGEQLVTNGEYANGIQIFKEKSNVGTWESYDLDSGWSVQKINGGASSCKVTSFEIFEDEDCSSLMSSSSRVKIEDEQFKINLVPQEDSVAYVCAETSGGVRSSIKVNATICGNQTISLADDQEPLTLNGTSETNLSSLFKSSNSRCPEISFELVGVGNELQSKIKIEDAVLQLNLNETRSTIFQVIGSSQLGVPEFLKINVVGKLLKKDKKEPLAFIIKEKVPPKFASAIPASVTIDALSNLTDIFVYNSPQSTTPGDNDDKVDIQITGIDSSYSSFNIYSSNSTFSISIDLAKAKSALTNDTDLVVSVKLSNSGQESQTFDMMFKIVVEPEQAQETEETKEEPNKTEKSQSSTDEASNKKEDKTKDKKDQNDYGKSFDISSPIKINVKKEDEEPVEIPRPAQISIQQPSSLGYVPVRFSKPMIFPQSWHDRLKRDREENKDGAGFRRNLEQYQDDINSQPTFNVLDPDGGESSLKFRIFLVKLTDKEAGYQMVFEKPQLVSFASQNSLQSLQINFDKNVVSQLKDQEGQQAPLLTNENNGSVFKKLPPQLKVSERSRGVTQQTATATKAVKGLVVTQFCLTFFLSFSLSTLWGMLNGIAMIVYVPMMNITFPSNFNVLNSYLIQIVTFDIVPYIDWLNDEFFTTRYSEGEIEQPALGFSLNGFESYNYTKNTGSLYIFTIQMISSSLFFNIMRVFALNYCFIRFYQKYRINENLNAVLMRFVMQGYTDLLIASLLTMELTYQVDIIYTSWPDAFGYTMAFGFFIYITVLPLFIQRKLSQKFMYLDAYNSPNTTDDYKALVATYERKFDKEWISFYDGLKPTSKSAMMYNYFFIIRKFFFVISAYYLYDYANIQILLFVNGTQLYLMYMFHAKPFSDRFTTIQETFNEVGVLIVGYHCMCFTDFVADAEMKFEIGYSQIAIISVNLCFGLGNLIYVITKHFRTWCSRQAMLKKDKAIRIKMIEKYSPYAQKMIIAAGIRGITVEEEMVNYHSRRINFLKKHMSHTRLGNPELKDPSPAPVSDQGISKVDENPIGASRKYKRKFLGGSSLKTLYKDQKIRVEQLNYNHTPTQVSSLTKTPYTSPETPAILSLIDQIETPMKSRHSKSFEQYKPIAPKYLGSKSLEQEMHVSAMLKDKMDKDSYNREIMTEINQSFNSYNLKKKKKPRKLPKI